MCEDAYQKAKMWKGVTVMYYKGVCFCLMGTALFTPIFAMGKLADGMFPAIALMTMRYVGGFITILIVALSAGASREDLRSQGPSQHFIRASLGAAGGICAVHAATVIPVAYATSIGLTQGVIVILFAGLFLKELIQIKHCIACGISILGALLIVLQSLDVTDVQASLYIGVITAFAGAIFIAIETLFIKVLARREHAIGVLLYVNGFGACIMIGISAMTLPMAEILRWEILPFLAVGPFAIAAQFFNIKAYRLVDASRLAPVTYSWILFSTALGWAAFGEVPTMLALFGASLIVAGGLIVTWPNAPLRYRLNRSAE